MINLMMIQIWMYTEMEMEMEMDIGVYGMTSLVALPSER